MDAQTFLDNFATVADAPGGVLRLRDLVLDLAISGLLVEQDPADEPADGLLQRIRATREQLVDGGILNRPKSLPSPVPNGVDCPPGWTRVSLAEAITWDLTDGDWVESKDQDPSGDVRLVQLADVGKGDFKDKSDRYLTSETADQLNCTRLMPGDVLIARLPNPLGRACVFPGTSQVCVTVVDVAIARVGPDGLNPRFLVHVMNSSQMRERVEAVAAGTTRKRVSTGNLRKLPVLVPPLAEQERIVAKVDELLGLCDRLELALGERGRIASALGDSLIYG